LASGKIFLIFAAFLLIFLKYYLVII